MFAKLFRKRKTSLVEIYENFSIFKIDIYTLLFIESNALGRSEAAIRIFSSIEF